MTAPLPTRSDLLPVEVAAREPNVSRGPTRRAALLGLLLVPPLVAWSEYIELKARGPDMISTSVILSLFAFVLALLVVNAMVRRFAPRFALSVSEIVLIYALGSVGIAPAGIGLMQWLVPDLPASAHTVRPESGLASLLALQPVWSRVSDPETVKSFYAGQSSFFTFAHLRAWAGPMLFWSLFLLAAFVAMYCLTLLFRRYWIEQERLLFPLAQVPLEVIRGGETGLWRQPVFWAGCLLPVILEGMAAIHFSWMPTFPYVPMKPDDTPQIQSLFAAPPWDAVSYLRLTFYPFVIGLAFLIPLNISFSCWFFYLASKGGAVILAAQGVGRGGADLWSHEFPHYGDQAFGSFVGLTGMVFWLARTHLASTLRAALSRGPVANREEASAYRAAWSGLLLSGGTMVAFEAQLGLPLAPALLFTGGFFAVVVGLTRLRSEGGVPWGYGPPMNVHGAVVDVVGTGIYAPRTLAAFGSLLWIDHDYRSTWMPYPMETMKLADGQKWKGRSLAGLLFAALLIGLASAWLSQLHLYYRYGAESANFGRAGDSGARWLTLTQNWLDNPRPLDSGRMGAITFGVATTIGLSLLSTRCLWWPLSPLGYVAANVWTMQWLWCPFLIGWLCKAVTLRYGGMGGYRALLPFFYGLVVGDFAISGLLAVLYSVFKIPGYRTFPI